MNRTKINKLMNTFLGISSLMIIIGAYLKIMHYPVGNSVFIWSLVLNTVLSGIEIQRLKQIIKETEYK